MHPFIKDAQSLRERLSEVEVLSSGDIDGREPITLRLPAADDEPFPSERLAHAVEEVQEQSPTELGTFSVEALRVAAHRGPAVLLRIEDRLPGGELLLGHDLTWWLEVARFATELLIDQRFIPTLYQRYAGEMRAAWRPWLHDDAARKKFQQLLASMPPLVRATVEEVESSRMPILEEILNNWTDAHVRATLIADDFSDALDERDPAADEHVAWLTGLLDRNDTVPGTDRVSVNMLQGVRRWIGQLHESDAGKPFRLCLRLEEPTALSPDSESNEPWPLSFALTAVETTNLRIEAEKIWQQGAAALPTQDTGGPSAQDMLLTELGRAGRLYPPIAEALEEAAPTGIDLTAAEAYAFLNDDRSVLEESGIVVIVPEWWGQPDSRLGVRLIIDSDERDDSASDSSQSPSVTEGDLGFDTLVRYRWQIALGEQPLSAEQLEELAGSGDPLVRIDERWIEIRPEDLAEAQRVVEVEQGGEITAGEAMHLAYDVGDRTTTLPILGVDISGWAAEVFGPAEAHAQFEKLDQPESFEGELRPYQKIGLSWLAFLDRYGFGGCLADDMGLGKTIQLIALLQHERENGAQPGPTLLIVPTSVIENWRRELERFAPQLTVHVNHGVDRPSGDAFVDTAMDHDVIITTYPLITRDRESLEQVQWWRVVLDEAQHIKNPPTKQASAIRALQANRRVAMTGTPVENRLNELWSIMEFCNPGYLSTQPEFRRRFAIPIERHRDQHRGEQLRSLIQPFVLRRLKTDPQVISDLPSLLETKEYARLCGEQARLYESVVNEILTRVDASEGIQRRGLVLSSLVKLKQICNHPDNFLHSREDSNGSSKPERSDQSLSSRSGKSTRLIEMLEEIVAANDQALVFTQYRQMGHLLVAMIQHDLDREALFLHGGTPQAKRQQLIDRFQQRDGSAPVFVLSLRAGGVGLNLTAANHVFHYDRWWNPAVENQATDRAFRIGQTRNVHVHKFICPGTLEERIDQMISRKTALAEQIIGSGENWITELSTNQLRDLLTLRQSALEESS